MKLLSVTLTAVLAAVLLHHATGASTGRTEVPSMLVSSLNQMRRHLKQNSSFSSWFPARSLVQAPKTKSAGYAEPLECYECDVTILDGKAMGDENCKDSVKDVSTVKCKAGVTYCYKVETKASGDGPTAHEISRGCSPYEPPLTCVAVKLSGTETSEGKTMDVSVVSACCKGDKCNGAPSVNYSGKIIASILGLLLTVFYTN